MRILFLAYCDMLGQFYPYLPLVEELKRQGHEIGWVCRPARVGTRWIPNGVVPIPVPGLTDWIASLPEGEATHREQGDHLLDLAAVVAGDRARYLSPLFASDLVKLQEVFDAFRPDVIAIDGLIVSAGVAAQRSGIPWATVCATLEVVTPDTFDDPLHSFDPELRPFIKGCLAAHGLVTDMLGSNVLSPYLNTAFTTDALVGEQASATTFLAGPSLPKAARDPAALARFPWDRLRGDRPLVYTSLGTAQADSALYVMVAEAAHEIGAQCVFSTAAFSEGEVPPLPGDAIVTDFVPQIELLPKVAAFVTRSGANSVMESLAFGVPMLMVPGFMDQFLNAHFVEKLGPAAPGSVLLREAVTVEALCTSLRALIDPKGAARAGAKRVQASYAANDGARRTEERLVALARTPRAR